MPYGECSDLVKRKNNGRNFASLYIAIIIRYI